MKTGLSQDDGGIERIRSARLGWVAAALQRPIKLAAQVQRAAGTLKRRGA